MRNVTNIEVLASTAPDTFNLESIANDGEIQSLIGDISVARFGEYAGYELGDVDSMTAAIRRAFDFRIPGGERTEREDLPQPDVFGERITGLAKNLD